MLHFSTAGHAQSWNNNNNNNNNNLKSPRDLKWVILICLTNYYLSVKDQSEWYCFKQPIWLYHRWHHNYAEIFYYLTEGLYNRLMVHSARWSLQQSGEEAELFYRYGKFSLEKHIFKLRMETDNNQSYIKVSLFSQWKINCEWIIFKLYGFHCSWHDLAWKWLKSIHRSKVEWK